jgi:hypothetical protein
VKINVLGWHTLLSDVFMTCVNYWYHLFSHRGSLTHKEIFNLHISRFSGQLVTFLDLTLNKSVLWKTCEYQSGSKFDKIACVKIWRHLA